MGNTNWRDHTYNMNVSERVRLCIEDVLPGDWENIIDKLVSAVTTLVYVCTNSEVDRRRAAESACDEWRAAALALKHAVHEVATQRDEARAEVERLKAWRELYESAPDGAKGVIHDRAVMTEAIQPIIKSWKDEVERLRAEVERLKAELAQAERRSAVKALRRADEAGTQALDANARDWLRKLADRIESGEEVL